MTAPGMLYVCDHCGHIEVRDAVPEGAEWTCDSCGGHAAWEFPPEKRANAEQQAAHIAHGHDSEIFRRVRA